MYWDRFDICEAWYVYATNYHQGQWSRAYEIFGRLLRMGYRPGAMGVSEETLTENGREIYNQLIEQDY